MSISKLIIHKQTYFIFCRQNRDVVCKQVSKILENFNWSLDSLNPEVVIIIGGDGSFIDAFHHFEKQGKTPYYLFFNAGYLGFFSTASVDNMKEILSGLVTNKLVIQKVDALEVETNRKKFYAINELKIMSLMKTCLWNVTIKTNKAILHEELTATGIVFATTLGSNGLVRTLGASVIIPTLDIIQYSKIAPVHNKTSTPILGSIVISGDSTILVELLKKEETFSYIDNNIDVGKNIKKYIIKLVKNKLSLLTLEDENFFFQKMKKAYNF